MTSFAPPTCRECHAEVSYAISGKTGLRIRLNPVPDASGTMSVAREPQGRVARVVPRDLRNGADLWTPHAQTCPARRANPRRMTPRNLAMDFAGTEGTAPEVALARTQAHAAELTLDRLADELIAEWKLKCHREGWFPIWRLLDGFIARRGADLPKELRGHLSAVVGRKIHPESARLGDLHRRNRGRNHASPKGVH